MIYDRMFDVVKGNCETVRERLPQTPAVFSATVEGRNNEENIVLGESEGERGLRWDDSVLIVRVFASIV